MENVDKIVSALQAKFLRNQQKSCDNKNVSTRRFAIAPN
jgi:hypothetical protein